MDTDDCNMGEDSPQKRKVETVCGVEDGESDVDNLDDDIIAD